MLEKSLVMESGAVVICRPVPPYAQVAVRAQLPPEPVYPTVVITSKSGSSETHPALQGSPEYAEYRKEKDAYTQLIAFTMSEFMVNYGVVKWKLPDQQDFMSEVLDTWELPYVARLYGVLPAPDDPAKHRAQYIQFELIQTDADQDSIENVLYSLRALTKKEIIDALSPFSLNDMVDLFTLVKAARVLGTQGMQPNA